MPVTPVAANAVATSGWANSVATSINDIEADIYAAGQLAIPWSAITGEPLTFAPILAPAVAAITYGQAKADGVSASAAHADHIHGTPPLPTPAQLAIGWTDVTGKPTSFAPTAHQSSHASGGADVLPLPWANITGKPSTFTPAAHAASHYYGAADQLTAGDVRAIEARNTPSSIVSGRRLYVGTSTPSGAAEGDVWIKG